MNPPASASGGQEAGKPEGATFGVDAPVVPLVLGGAASLLAITGIVLMITSGLVGGLVAVIFGLFLGLCVFSYLYTTLQGKFVWWADLLDDAGEITAEDDGERVLGHLLQRARGDEDVDGIDRGGAHAHEQLVVAGARLCDVVSQRGLGAEFVEGEGLHRRPFAGHPRLVVGRFRGRASD